MRHVCIFLIGLYRKIISPLKKKPTCRFYPTCSQYAIDAYKKHGFFGGTFLSVKRICKCNPLFKGGIDHVPERIVFGKKKSENSENGEL